MKILFRYYSNVLEEETVETMWAIPIDQENGLYKLDNIPFYGPSVASDDIIYAEYDDTESMLTYRRVVEYSGNSVVQVVIMKNGIDINDIRKIFEHLGCVSERVNEKYFAMEIPCKVGYAKIKAELLLLKKQGIIDYAEPCLSEQHREQISL